MSIIADLIRAGVDPELVERVVEWHEAGLKEVMSGNVRGHNAELDRRRALDAQRKRLKRKESAGMSADKKGSSSSPLVPPSQTLPPIIPQTPPPKKTRPATQPLEILKTVLSEQTAEDVIAHRKAKRAPLTPRAAELLVAAFRDHGNPEAAAEAMIANGWQGFKPEWLNGHQARAGPAGRSNGTQGFLEAVARDIENDRRRREESTSQIVLSLPEFRQRSGA